MIKVSWLKIIIVGLLIYIINVFFFQVCIVYGNSMEPILKSGQMVLVKKYNLNLNYGDIVVIKKGKHYIIKRLVGLPNDKIFIDDYLYVNGEKFDNDYIEDNGEYSDVQLNENEYYCLGDNRQNSIDSRFYEVGIILKSEIIGKVEVK